MASQTNEGVVGSNVNQENEESIRQYSFEQAIEKLEEVFNQVQNPENHVIEQLSEELGLDPTQVEIWFDNKRWFIQAQRDMEERKVLRLENEKLCAENLQLDSELKKRVCAPCCNPENQKILKDLQNENAKLKEDVTKISSFVDYFEDLEDPEEYVLLLKQDWDLRNYNDPNGLDLELTLERNEDPNGLELECNEDPNGLELECNEDPNSLGLDLNEDPNGLELELDLMDEDPNGLDLDLNEDPNGQDLDLNEDPNNGLDLDLMNEDPNNGLDLDLNEDPNGLEFDLRLE